MGELPRKGWMRFLVGATRKTRLKSRRQKITPRHAITSSGNDAICVMHKSKHTSGNTPLLFQSLALRVQPTFAHKVARAMFCISAISFESLRETATLTQLVLPSTYEHVKGAKTLSR